MAIGPAKIDGVPEIMGSYDTTANLKDFKPDKAVDSEMDEGKAFAAKDKGAIEDLTDFITQTGLQLRSATNTARADKHEYIGADKDAGAQLLAVAFQPASLPTGEAPTLQPKEPDA